MNNEYNCANSLYGIGTISELNINFLKNEYDDVVIQGCIILNINNSYVLSYVNINNSNQKKYYDFIKLLGLPYNFIQSVDEQPYILSNPLIKCYHGKIKANGKVVHTIESDKPSQIYFVGRLNANSITLNYGVLVDNQQEYIKGYLQGIKLATDEFISIYQDSQSILPICDLSSKLIYDELYSIEIEGYVDNDFEPVKYTILTVDKLEPQYTKEYIDESFKKYKLIQKARLNEQKK